MKMNKNKQQYVYVMSNTSFPEFLKIGWTREHPSIRANDLYTTGVPNPFIIENVIETPDGSKLEKQIHNHIKNYRVNDNREFFKISKDELYEKLTNELQLELKLITNINTPINTRKTYHKKVNEIKLLYEEVKKEIDEFFSKFEKEKSELLVKKMNNKKYVYISDVEYDQTPLYMHGFEDIEEKRIKNAYYFINKDFVDYKKWLDNLIDNYEEIKNKIGIKQLRSDNKSFKEMILKTHERFCNIKNEYEWVF